VRFARTGDPNGAGLSKWPAFTPERAPTMVFDTRCELLNAPDAKEQAVVAAMYAA
jgi:para-nitrobenzyl esterase